MATSASLKDRVRYPLTVQTFYDSSLLEPAQVAFFKAMGWNRVGMVNENIQAFIQVRSNIMTSYDVIQRCLVVNLVSMEREDPYMGTRVASYTVSCNSPQSAKHNQDRTV